LFRINNERTQGTPRCHNNTSKKFNNSKVSAPRAKKYMGYNPKVNSEKGGVLPKMSYATESPLPC